MKAVDASGNRYSQPQHDTPEFKRWHEGSKAVDNTGKPLMAYHGAATPDGDRFWKFDPQPSVRSGFFGIHKPVHSPVSFFSESPSVSGSFAEDKADYSSYGTGPTKRPWVHQVYLSIKNPIDLTGPNAKQLMRRHGLTDEYDEVPDKRHAWQVFDHPENVEKLKALGHDGAIISEYDAAKVFGFHKAPGATRTWVAFHPTQVKSAIHNNGNFDPNDPDIRKAVDPYRCQWPGGCDNPGTNFATPTYKAVCDVHAAQFLKRYPEQQVVPIEKAWAPEVPTAGQQFNPKNPSHIELIKPHLSRLVSQHNLAGHAAVHLRQVIDGLRGGDQGMIQHPLVQQAIQAARFRIPMVKSVEDAMEWMSPEDQYYAAAYIQHLRKKRGKPDSTGVSDPGMIERYMEHLVRPQGIVVPFRSKAIGGSPDEQAIMKAVGGDDIAPEHSYYLRYTVAPHGDRKRGASYHDVDAEVDGGMATNGLRKVGGRWLQPIGGLCGYQLGARNIRDAIDEVKGGISLETGRSLDYFGALPGDRSALFVGKEPRSHVDVHDGEVFTPVKVAHGDLRKEGVNTVSKAAGPTCPHCGSGNYRLYAPDFETAKCADCGKTFEVPQPPKLTRGRVPNGKLSAPYQGNNDRPASTQSIMMGRP